MSADEYRQAFDRALGAQLLLREDLTVHAANDACLQILQKRREDVVGRDVSGWWQGGELRASLADVLRDKRAHRCEARLAHDQRDWSITNTPLLDAHGGVQWILHTLEEVTDLRRELHDAHARSERLLELLDAAPDATVITGQDGVVQLVNRQTELLFGYRRDELIGQPLEVLIPERYRPGHAEHLRRYFRSPTTRPMGSGLALYGRRKDGSELPIEVSLSPHVRQGEMTVSAAIRDISERKRLEAAARLNADRLTSAVDASQDAFALFDADDRLVLCNAAYRKLLHADSPASLIGKPFAQLFDAWTRDMEFASEHERLAWRDEQAARRQQGAAYDVRLRDGRRMRVVDRRTAEGGIVKTIWDLTTEELRAEELREARAAAEAASEAKSEFLASMSHELRTPMNAILGFAQLLQWDKREPLSERHRERVSHILTGGEHLLRLIDDVLDLARIEAGRVSVFTESVPLAGVLADVQKTLEPLAARNEIRLELEASAAVDATLAADRTRFAQILINFGTNAIKYNRRGGKVVFRCSHPRRGFVRVTVVDDGFGIPQDKQAKLFQPFQRAGQETGSIEGTGIGLVITRRLATLMGGDVGFRSEPGLGSEFWVDMPLKPVNSLLAPARRQDARVEHVAAPIGERVLLYVEDNPANVSFMRDLIESFEGVELLIAGSAEEGLEVARARTPAAILMDINLPGMSGLEALRVLRSEARTAQIPVIALTAAASERDQCLGLQAGFFRYLTKPVRVDELVGALEQVLAAL